MITVRLSPDTAHPACSAMLAPVEAVERRRKPA